MFGAFSVLVRQHWRELQGEVPTNTALPVRSGLVASVARALVGSRHVDTLAVLAQVVTELALVQI